jgi:hypothetical protein
MSWFKAVSAHIATYACQSMDMKSGDRNPATAVNVIYSMIIPRLPP